ARGVGVAVVVPAVAGAAGLRQLAGRVVVVRRRHAVVRLGVQPGRRVIVVAEAGQAVAAAILVQDRRQLIAIEVVDAAAYHLRPQQVRAARHTGQLPLGVVAYVQAHLRTGSLVGL